MTSLVPLALAFLVGVLVSALAFTQYLRVRMTLEQAKQERKREQHDRKVALLEERLTSARATRQALEHGHHHCPHCAGK